MTAVRSRILLAALLLAAVPAGAAQPDRAYGAYQAGHYRRALDEALKRIEANSTDAAAMTLLGEIYRQGLGVRADDRIATEWYQRAAERGDVNATFALAMALFEGRGTTRDVERGGKLLQQAAAAGHASANYNLAMALLGTGRPDDDRRAFAALETAAKANLADAEYALAILNKQGRGTPRDLQAAARWMELAARNGAVAAEVEYAIMLFNGAEGVTRDERRAVRLFRLAASKGNAIAQNRLARLYQSGLGGVAPDAVEAAAWHLAARAQGLNDATLDALLNRLTPEQGTRAARLAADRIEGAALTALTMSPQPSK